MDNQLENQNVPEPETDSVPLTMKEAIAESKRCLNCKKPTCRTGCPIENEIPDFINQLSKGNLGEARAILARKTNLPAVCGRVCPHEKQCEGHCILGKKGNPIKIGKLEQFIADFDADMNLTRENIPAKTRGKVAVIGSGPAGLTVAGDLAIQGFSVVVYESESEPGGILLYGIPQFRLPKDVVRRETKRIEELGVHFINNCIVGQDITIDQIFERGFDAIFIGTGTALARELDIPGKEFAGVVQSNYFLRMVTMYNDGKINKQEVSVTEGDNVLVIGAGNVAMDASRTALRMGAKNVTVVYRSTPDTITASKIEYDGAVGDGVKFMWETTPIEYIGKDGKIIGLKADCAGSEIIIPADKILLAIGSKPARRIISTTKGIDVNEAGYVITKERPYGMTTLKGVFAGGDVVHQPATVVLAMKEAKKVVAGISAYVDAKKLLEE
ncbi:MAG: NAD(P)-dependent oxidoreductase [Clostridiales bacterium]|nr:NAD(P)-dependent oxidoreductase [Clostridiales bacterium]